MFQNLTSRISELEVQVSQLEEDKASRSNDVNAVVKQRDTLALKLSKADCSRVNAEFEVIGRTLLIVCWIVCK